MKPLAAAVVLAALAAAYVHITRRPCGDTTCTEAHP